MNFNSLPPELQAICATFLHMLNNRTSSQEEIEEQFFLFLENFLTNLTSFDLVEIMENYEQL